jgi:hypothetical protein
MLIATVNGVAPAADAQTLANGQRQLLLFGELGRVCCIDVVLIVIIFALRLLFLFVIVLIVCTLFTTRLRASARHAC